MTKQYCLFILGCFLTISNSAQTYNIINYGAISDGKTINTKSIQSAIDLCTTTGGRVIVPAGVFVTGTLYLKSNITIYLDSGATILGSPSFIDYPDNEVRYKNFFTHFPDGRSRTNKALFFAEGVDNISITGKGTIDGNGASKEFNLGDDATSQKSKDRPCTILFISCKKVAITNLHLTNPAYWLQNYLNCDGLLLKRLIIYNHSNTNVDGMDIDSRNVTIDSCNIDSDDDAICFKSHSRNNICENITVRNCTIASNCNAIKFGTTSIGGFRNIRIDHCIIHKSAESPIFHWQNVLKFINEPITVISGVSIEVTDGGIADNIHISDIQMNDVQTPFFFFLGNRGRKQVGDTTVAPIGRIQNITVNNIVATSHSKMSSSITSFPGHYIENVSLTNIQINNTVAGDSDEAKIILPENPTAYPENRLYGDVYPANGLYIRHAKNIRLNNIFFNMCKNESRPAIIMNDVIGGVVNNIKLSSSVSKSPAIKVIDCRHIAIEKK